MRHPGGYCKLRVKLTSRNFPPGAWGARGARRAPGVQGARGVPAARKARCGDAGQVRGKMGPRNLRVPGLGVLEEAVAAAVA